MIEELKNMGFIYVGTNPDNFKTYCINNRTFCYIDNDNNLLNGNKIKCSISQLI
jgi:hypothetical protein